MYRMLNIRLPVYNVGSLLRENVFKFQIAFDRLHFSLAPLDYYCDQPADIALLLDSSTYFKPLNFEEQKRFAESFITYFKLRQTRFGATIAVVPYSDKKIERSTIANFFYSRSIPFLTRKIKKLKFQGGKSKLEDALRFARDDLFVSKMGARTWVPRVVVAITGSWRTWGTWQTNEVENIIDHYYVI